MVFGAASVMLIGADAHAQAGAACKPGGTVAEINACAVQDFQAADATIQIPQLRQEHSAWVRERTMQCKRETQATEAQPEGPRLYHQCLTRKTQERRKGLMRWLSNDSPAKP